MKLCSTEIPVNLAHLGFTCDIQLGFHEFHSGKETILPRDDKECHLLWSGQSHVKDSWATLTFLSNFEVTCHF